jgi:hypothetical protein
MEGSKTLTLALTNTDLLAQMKEHSYYLGEALKSNPAIIELAAKIQACDDDDTVLKDFVQAGGTKLGNILSRVVGKTNYKWDETKKTITFTTNAVANFMDAQKDTLKDSMLNYLSYYVLSKWLNLIKPDESVRFEQQLTGLEEDMRQLGAQRDKPSRT